MVKVRSLNLVFLGILPFLLACASSSLDGDRAPAQIQNSEPTLLYRVNYGKLNAAVVEPVVSYIDSVQWESISPNQKLDWLIQSYYANSREASHTQNQWHVCYTGSGSNLVDMFFNPQNRKHEISRIESGRTADTVVSEDEKMIGFYFETKSSQRVLSSYYFRMENCSAGKSSILNLAKAQAAFASQQNDSKEWKSFSRIRSSDRQPAGVNAEYGFNQTDKYPVEAKDLPKFSLKSDFENSKRVNDKRPWKGMDISTSKGALQFALVMIKYVFEGMANQNTRNPDFNFQPEKSSINFWCHMPWMNVGNSRREVIHGLTKERDLQPSDSGIPYFRDLPQSTNWGIGFYNAPGCRTLGKVFGESKNRKLAPDWRQSNFEDGTVSAKILFSNLQQSAVKNSKKWAEIQQAFPFKAHVSSVNSNTRNLSTVYLMQIDIAVKDSTLKGTKPENNSWVMVTYYFDPSYNFNSETKPVAGIENPLLQLGNIHPGLLKMRPQGVQVGFSSKETILFAGAYSNGFEGRLNGPADNPKSSCIGCHATAGTKTPMSPGFMNSILWNSERKRPHLDFSQQLALAKRNFQTQLKGKAD